ncbi:PLP-dependent aminotransferase family protein [Paenibacillus sp. J2TS4]|uniref:aminotransferase-like domain-containing protein n=1 Tax=Paenibacillus sp. J2TS4 TaxID=2807194 RepID=UPI001AFDD4CF|nr:PLP-dependent aminotransferase family protein [Paenibacillus sp. J2TS4]GIP34438.1 aminotransferase [Paenibacillus sp. J2TS4]
MDYQFSETLKHFKSSAVRDILKLTQGKSIISFAGGLPGEELFPVEAVKDAFGAVLDQGPSALQYGLTEGYLPLREALCERMLKKNMTVTPDEMILTTGSQQAIDLLTRIYIDPGDVVLVQQPTYLAALQVFQSRGARIVSVKGDESGMDLADAEAKIRQHKPKLLYVSPTFSNPTGYVWSIERRKGILELCRNHNVLILEDDPYGELQYDLDSHYPTIFSLDEHPHGSAVVYTSTFSKTVAPALRTGWAVGDPAIIQNMARAKQASDLHSSTMDQQALYQLLRRFDLDAHIVLIRNHYGQRLRLMNELLNGLDIPGLRWNQPKGGMFLWLELPDGCKAEELLVSAVEEGVAFVPGTPFYADEPRTNTCRFNFTHSGREEMALGIERFSRAMSSFVPS